MTKTRSWSSRLVVEYVSAAPAAVKSAARALRVVEFFDEIRRPARANEIAERLAIPQSSASVLLNSLVRLGYLDFDVRAKTYVPSIRIAVLATWRDTGCFRDGSMLALLEGLAARTGLAACLVGREGIFTRYLQIVQSTRPGGVHIPLSVRRFAVKSAPGIVLLGDEPDAEIRLVVHRTRAEEAAKVPGMSLHDVMERVERARADSYFLSDGLVDPRNGGIAVALPTAITGGWQKMALSVAGRREEVSEREGELVGSLVEAVRSVVPPSGSGS